MTETIPTETIPNYERAAADLEAEQTRLAEAMLALRQHVEAAEAAHLPAIRRLAAGVARRRAALLSAVAARPEDWQAPKSAVLHNWKLGWRKQPGVLVVADEPSAIARLRQLLKGAATPLIRYVESLNKAALRDQPADVLAKIGITLTADTDAPFLTRVGGDVDKAVAELLQRAEERAQAARN